MFDVKTSKGKDKNKIVFVEDGQFDFIGRTSVNYGIQGHINKMEYDPNDAETFSVAQVGETVALYRKNKWYGSQNMFVLTPKDKSIISNHLFFESSFYRALRKYADAYVYPTLDDLKDIIIALPIVNNMIDYGFMESFVAELEALCIAELEAYLKVTGLKDYNLTKEEEKALKDYNQIEYKNFDVIKMFEVKNTHNILSTEIKKYNGSVPYLCASAENNSVNSYVEHNRNLLDKGNCIFIGGKTFVVSYQKEDFFSNDSHNLALYYKEDITENEQLFLATCVRKSLSHKYSWGDSVSKTKIKSEMIALPVFGDECYIKFSNNLINAIKKLVIKDVVDYVGKKISTTMLIIK